MNFKSHFPRHSIEALRLKLYDAGCVMIAAVTGGYALRRAKAARRAVTVAVSVTSWTGVSAGTSPSASRCFWDFVRTRPPLRFW